MSARLLALAAFTSALALGCGASGRAEVEVTDLAMTVEPGGAVRAGSFNLHVARPASASGPSAIRLHRIEIRDSNGFGVEVTGVHGELPGDLDPGADVVRSIQLDLERASSTFDAPFDTCSAPGGFVLEVTYFDEAEGAFFTVRSPTTWIPPRLAAGASWAATFGDAAMQIVHDTAAFPDGSAVVVGSTLHLAGDGGSPDGTPLVTPLVIKFDAAGKTAWSRSFASSLSSMLTDKPGPSLVAASPSGAIVLAGVLVDPLDLGDGPITSAGSTDVLLARLDPSGKAIATRRFGDSLTQTVAALGVDSDGNALLAGTLAGAMDFGAGPIAPIISPAVTSYYVARLPEAGAPIYARVPLALASPSIFVAAFGAEGTAVLGGSFTGNAWIGDEPPHQTGVSAGLLVVLAPDGSIVWSEVTDNANVTQVAIDHGDVVATLLIQGDVSLGGKSIMGGSPGSMVLARFDPTGALRYALPLGDPNSLEVSSLVVDSAGHTLIAGDLTTPLALVGSTVGQDGHPSTFFAEVDAQGHHVRSLAFGCQSTHPDLAVAPTGSRDVTLASTFEGAVDLGQGPIPAAGATDLLVTRLPAL